MREPPVTITVNGRVLQGNTEDSLLLQLEKSGLTIESQCRDGVCGACRCKLVSGLVSKTPTIAWTGKNEILACSSTPQSDVELSFSYSVTEKVLEMLS